MKIVVVIVFAKAQARLKIVCPGGADEKDIFYLSQFTTVSAAEKFDQKDGSKAIIYNSVSDKHLKSILSEGGEPTLLLSVENPLITELENAARQEPSYFVAAQAEYVFAAILSLLLEKESYGV